MGPECDHKIQATLSPSDAAGRLAEHTLGACISQAVLRLYRFFDTSLTRDFHPRRFKSTSEQTTQYCTASFVDSTFTPNIFRHLSNSEFGDGSQTSTAMQMHECVPGPIARYVPEACEVSLPTIINLYLGQHALWHVMGAHTGGIPLSEAGPGTSTSILRLGAQRQAFLLCLLNKGSEWEEW